MALWTAPLRIAEIKAYSLVGAALRRPPLSRQRRIPTGGRPEAAPTGETPAARYLSFRQELPKTVKAVCTGSEFYTTCAYSGGSRDLRLICKKRFVPDGFVPE